VGGWLNTFKLSLPKLIHRGGQRYRMATESPIIQPVDPIQSAPIGGNFAPATTGPAPVATQPADFISSYVKSYINTWKDERMKSFRPMNEFLGKYEPIFLT